jgi:hypothetical protein
MKKTLINIFIYNIQINTIILACLLVGIVTVYHRTFLYEKEYCMLTFADKTGAPDLTKARVIKSIPLHTNKNNRIILQNKIQSILDSVYQKVDEYASTPKYLSGTLIFLGLLGTFWGLSHTINNVAGIIDNLGLENQDANASFVQLKDSLRVPLSGMGIAFGCSLFGLSGSLILGFLLFNLKGASGCFVDVVEKWLSKHTVSFGGGEQQGSHNGNVFSMVLLEKTIETIYTFQGQLNDLAENRTSVFAIQAELSTKITELTRAMTANQDFVNKLAQNQIELTKIADISVKLDLINTSIHSLMQDSASGRRAVIQSLGNDIRVISKVLSSLMDH